MSEKRESYTILRPGWYHLRRLPHPNHNRRVEEFCLGRYGTVNGHEQMMWRIKGRTQSRTYHPAIVAQGFVVLRPAECANAKVI